MSDYPIVVVMWLDSGQPEAAWQWADEILKPAPIVCQTVGHLIHDTSAGIVVALSIGDATSERPQANGVMHIPRSAIQQLTSLAPCEQVRDA
ncbi:hypothetical protein [Komagataeibacter sp. FNDCF1]|uniref:hypothetical protein n=1 Tax=Komagataeibacter sp. FNDCF1 TaxID=2878681 RepID=UPI001E33638C|nr:hypothetical protein [Komagataeibacter sp. FNDCF1]MCE2564159.1 hypothetical protein [Komagataeibacter sp. FNDCF1]